MPRLYLTPQELNEMPLGIALSAQLALLAPGVLDKLLARVSRRVDGYCEKRLQAPGTTTLSASASAGAPSISVTSTLTLDNLAENAVILDSGLGSQETVLIQPGGVSVTSWQSPYPGTLTLATPLQFGHSNGAAVQFVYQEVNETRRASMADPYSEALQSQAAQLALAHLPPVHVGLNRIQFVNHYPIITVLLVEHAYSFDTTYNLIYQSNSTIYAGGIIVEPTAGFYRYRVGTVVIPEGFTRTTYIGGYEAIPDDVKLAAAYLLTDELAVFANPYGAVDSSMGKRRQAFTLAQGKTPNVQRAEAILEAYRRTV